jgi:hypothetical protein
MIRSMITLLLICIVSSAMAFAPMGPVANSQQVSSKHSRNYALFFKIDFDENLAWIYYI